MISHLRIAPTEIMAWMVRLTTKGRRGIPIPFNSIKSPKVSLVLFICAWYGRKQNDLLKLKLVRQRNWLVIKTSQALNFDKMYMRLSHIPKLSNFCWVHLLSLCLLSRMKYYITRKSIMYLIYLSTFHPYRRGGYIYKIHVIITYV